MQDWGSRLQPLTGAAFPAELIVATIRAPHGVVGLRWLLRDTRCASRREPRRPTQPWSIGGRAYCRTATYEYPVAGRNCQAPTRRR
jgi:hypothetical protein